jgi:hypothetical protein
LGGVVFRVRGHYYYKRELEVAARLNRRGARHAYAEQFRYENLCSLDMMLGTAFIRPDFG